MPWRVAAVSRYTVAVFFDNRCSHCREAEEGPRGLPGAGRPFCPISPDLEAIHPAGLTVRAELVTVRSEVATIHPAVVTSP